MCRDRAPTWRGRGAPSRPGVPGRSFVLRSGLRLLLLGAGCLLGACQGTGAPTDLTPTPVAPSATPLQIPDGNQPSPLPTQVALATPVPPTALPADTPTPGATTVASLVPPPSAPASPTASPVIVAASPTPAPDTPASPTPLQIVPPTNTPVPPPTSTPVPVQPPNAASGTYALGVLADGPASYWRLDETIGGTAFDLRGTAPGTYAPGVAQGQRGALRNSADPAVDLSGTAGVYVPGNRYNFTGTAPFTLEAWVYPTTIDKQFRRILSKETYDATTAPPTRQGYALSYTTTDGGGLVFDRLAGQTIDELYYPTGLAANAWNYVAATYDGNVMQLYVNGVQVNTRPSHLALVATSTNLSLGARKGNGDNIAGKLDEVAIYPTALSAARIRAHYANSGIVLPDTPTPVPALLSPQVYWGAYLKGAPYGFDDAPWDWRTAQTFEAHAGSAMSILQWGQPWFSAKDGGFQTFEPAQFDKVRGQGIIPMINWDSWDPCCGGIQANWTLSTIIGGRYDDYIRQWATAARAWGHPFFVRFDDEMNGNWYPWSEQVRGNSPGQFVQMWRHVHDIFTQVGATNVTWVWTANSEFRGAPPLAPLYPGDAYVDWIGFAGYNWGTNPAKPDVWASFAQRFGPSYNIFTQIAPTKPILLGEIASSEFGGSKAAWITDMLTVQLPLHFPRVKAVVWFNWNADGQDWIIESSPSAQAAFAAGIAYPYYFKNNFANLPAGPVPPPGTWPVP